MSLPSCSGAPGHTSRDGLSLLTTVHPRGHSRASSAHVASVQHHSIIIATDMWLLDDALASWFHPSMCCTGFLAWLCWTMGMRQSFSQAQFAPTLRLSHGQVG